MLKQINIGEFKTTVFQPYLRNIYPDFRPGDTIKVMTKVNEGKKERIQVFEGIVIWKKGIAMSQSFLVQKISYNNVGVERIFPLHSPLIQAIEIVKYAKVRRARIYYIKARSRKSLKIKELKTPRTSFPKVII